MKSNYDTTTSLPAYKEVLETLSEKQRIVYNTIKELGVCSDKQIAKKLDWPINTVTPRRNELVYLGEVVHAEKKLSDDGRMVNFWEIHNINPQNN